MGGRPAAQAATYGTEFTVSGEGVCVSIHVQLLAGACGQPAAAHEGEDAAVCIQVIGQHLGSEMLGLLYQAHQKAVESLYRGLVEVG